MLNLDHKPLLLEQLYDKFAERCHDYDIVDLGCTERDTVADTLLKAEFKKCGVAANKFIVYKKQNMPIRYYVDWHMGTILTVNLS